ncbi:hypothetical protein ACFP1I_20290 [Dyadobacter subterraneus]|uniref:Addiction module component n=1 Tax=Dyadobacter subterraneus TaxID=2773304 RepID=A0ABR9W5R9_9BACT|nr:hypothetical protein [Dyadobacter subterraneus]MBE9460807.1 hypothetical protein [Dyadobacter subterraneus]
METVTIEIKDEKVRKLIHSLADLELISIIPNQLTWLERWKILSASLPQSSEITEDEILNEISEVRQMKLLD